MENLFRGTLFWKIEVEQKSIDETPTSTTKGVQKLASCRRESQEKARTEDKGGKGNETCLEVITKLGPCFYFDLLFCCSAASQRDGEMIKISGSELE